MDKIETLVGTFRGLSIKLRLKDEVLGQMVWWTDKYNSVSMFMATCGHALSAQFWGLDVSLQTSALMCFLFSIHQAGN